MKRGKIVFARDGSKRYLLDGKPVSQRAFQRAFPDKQPGSGGPFVPHGWPMVSQNLGCNPKQIKDMRKFLASRGVPTEFTKEGDCIITSRAHRKAICEARGFFDRNGGYGDAAPRQEHYDDARNHDSELAALIREGCEAMGI